MKPVGRDEAGIGLALAIVALVIIGVLIAGMSFTGTRELRVGENARDLQQSFGVICAEWWQRDCHQFRYRGPEPGHQPRSELPRPASRTADTSAKVAAESTIAQQRISLTQKSRRSFAYPRGAIDRFSHTHAPCPQKVKH